MKELRVEAKVNNLDQVLKFVEQQLEEHDCPMKVLMQMDVAVEEIFVNIAHYAYSPHVGMAQILMDVQPNPRQVQVTFIDSGMPFNPLARENPDVSLPASERQIGGLGIFMVKKSMDGMEYAYRDGKNVLKLMKKF